MKKLLVQYEVAQLTLSVGLDGWLHIYDKDGNVAFSLTFDQARGFAEAVPELLKGVE